MRHISSEVWVLSVASYGCYSFFDSVGFSLLQFGINIAEEKLYDNLIIHAVDDDLCRLQL